MFAAAMIFSAPAVECSIYSTCKRISQKLLRNVVMFLDLIFKGMGVRPFKVVRANTEELVLQGPNGDRRIVNSYPSKVTISLRSNRKEVADCLCIGRAHDKRNRRR